MRFALRCEGDRELSNEPDVDHWRVTRDEKNTMMSRMCENWMTCVKLFGSENLKKDARDAVDPNDDVNAEYCGDDDDQPLM